MSDQKMSVQRKMQLKSLLLQKAKEELQKEAERKAARKKEVLAERIQSLPDLNGMNDEELKQYLREIHSKIDKIDDARFDMEAKVVKNNKEIDDLNQKIFELRGKFKRPPLRRVKMSADQMLKALLGNKHKVTMDLRGNLKTAKK
jgi:predicted nuclease with TOPRIM domain